MICNPMLYTNELGYFCQFKPPSMLKLNSGPANILIFPRIISELITTTESSTAGRSQEYLFKTQAHPSTEVNKGSYFGEIIKIFTDCS